MTMTRWLVVAVALTSTVVGGIALAQNADVIQQRRKLFKTMDAGIDEMADMLRAKKPFDLAYVQKALRETASDAKMLKTMFPEDSKVGETRALPAVWEQKARFDGLFDDFIKVSDAAATTVTDEVSFKTEMPKVFATCKACHDDFRARRK